MVLGAKTPQMLSQWSTTKSPECLWACVLVCVSLVDKCVTCTVLHLLPSSLGPVTVEFVIRWLKALAVFCSSSLCGASDIGRNTSCFNEMQPEFGLPPVARPVIAAWRVRLVLTAIIVLDCERTRGLICPSNAAYVTNDSPARRTSPATEDRNTSCV